MRTSWLGLVMVASLGCHASFEAEVEDARTEETPVDAVEEAQADSGQWHVKCPKSTRWNGEVCMWRYVITDVKCPKMAVWDGARCVSTHVTCPDGAAWDGRTCIPIGERPAADPIATDDDGWSTPEPLTSPEEPVFDYR